MLSPCSDHASLMSLHDLSKDELIHIITQMRDICKPKPVVTCKVNHIHTGVGWNYFPDPDRYAEIISSAKWVNIKIAVSINIGEILTRVIVSGDTRERVWKGDWGVCRRCKVKIPHDIMRSIDDFIATFPKIIQINWEIECAMCL